MLIFPSFFSTCLAAVKFLTKDGCVCVDVQACNYLYIHVVFCLFLNEVEKTNPIV